MVKMIYALLALFLLQPYVYAQQDDTRTAATKIADLLAQQPSETSERFQEAMGQLERFSASEISALLQRLTPPGEGGNAGIEYATNSYSYYVLLPGKASQRATFLKGAMEALGAIANKDNKGYVIQLLQNAGDDTAIEALSGYLIDEYLSEKAARALACIGTESAGAALLESLPNATGVATIHIINALGFMAYAPAEPSILAMTEATDVNLRRVVLDALSKIGGKDAEQTLRKAAQDAGFVYDVTEATSAYINYAHSLIAKGEVRAAAKIASRLFKASKEANQVHTRIAALGLLTEVNRTKGVKSLVKVATDDNGIYRNAALSLLVPHLDSRVSSQLVKRLSRTDEQVQVDILRYLGNNKQSAALPEVRKALDTGSPAVRGAAIKAIHKLAGDAAVPELIGRLSLNDTSTRHAIKQVLLTSKNKQLPTLVTAALSTEKDPTTQVLLMDVLASRGAGESVPAILDIIQDDGPKEVETTAYKTLPQVARPEDLGKLLDLLSTAGGENAVFVQEAIVAAVTRSNDKAGQTQQVIARMITMDATSQPLFFPALSGIGGSEALKVVSDYTHHSDPNLQGAAIIALANWADAEALPTLIALSRKEVRDSNQQDAIIKGLVRIIGITDVPVDQKVLHLRDVFEVAKTVDQKKLVLKSLESNKTYNALLFAGKYLDDEQLKTTAATTVMNIALENKRFYGADVTRLLTKVIELLSGSESSYLREAIRKHLDELPKGSGYVSLFNGKDLEGWKGLVANPIKRAAMDAKTLAAEQAKADEAMRQGWYVKGGVLHFNGKGDNIATVKRYGDFEMLVDWELAKEGKDGDAGIYLRGTPQVQIWDTSRVNVGAQVGSGGLYNNKKHESKPLNVADNPLGEWNTFRITMVGERVTVYLNGELVTDSVVLENYWDRSLPIFPTEQIELQAHGTHVSYRDIHIRELPRKDVFTLSETEKQEGFEVLFDGTNLDAWTGNTTAYVVSDEGTLAIYPTEGSGGNLYTKETFSDFVYRFEFRLTPGANNGIGIRTPMEGDAAYAGMEVQVLDDNADMYKDLAEYQYHGSVYGIIPAKRRHLKPVGEWNEQEIHVRGNKIKVTLNGTVIVDGDLAEATKNGTLDKKNHPGLMRKSGHIAFLGHGSEVHFRRIRVKHL
ncbi:family 16 glycoside hydrolase [Parapedobacter tibetensis]|uniref:family 16 glycoside hydrolase n=1 Tax=Parapedobacter tibetensis TaxID=2972951 RepID=UPI00214DD50C|nr:family 16 glycoside hydrolase [Parapedobacter tibetensis]